jgi:hypothetical protein
MSGTLDFCTVCLLGRLRVPRSCRFPTALSPFHRRCEDTHIDPTLIFDRITSSFFRAHLARIWTAVIVPRKELHWSINGDTLLKHHFSGAFREEKTTQTNHLTAQQL